MTKCHQACAPMILMIIDRNRYHTCDNYYDGLSLNWVGYKCLKTNLKVTHLTVEKISWVILMNYFQLLD